MKKLVWYHLPKTYQGPFSNGGDLTVEMLWSRLLKQLMSALAEEGWILESNNGTPHLPLLLVFRLELPLLSRPVNILPILPGSAQTHSPRKPSWTHSLPAGFLRPSLHLSFLLKDPSYYAPSFVYVHTASLSSWGVRSVHQALCWTLTLIISNSHNELHSKYWPHFTDEEIETKWGHIIGLRTVSC